MSETLEQMKEKQAGAHLPDSEVASRVRMLTRWDQDHEMVCVMARDRIRYLSNVVEAKDREIERLSEHYVKSEKRVCDLNDEIERLKALQSEHLRGVAKSVCESASIGAMRQQTARECAEIASKYSGQAMQDIRERFGITE